MWYPGKHLKEKLSDSSLIDEERWNFKDNKRRRKLLWLIDAKGSDMKYHCILWGGLPDRLKKKLIEYVGEGVKPRPDDYCPKCGSELMYSGSGTVCINCDWGISE